MANHSMTIHLPSAGFNPFSCTLTGWRSGQAELGCSHRHNHHTNHNNTNSHKHNPLGNCTPLGGC